MTGKAKRRAQKRQARELQAATALEGVRTRGSARPTRLRRARPNLLNTAAVPAVIGAACCALIGLFLSGWTPGSSRQAASPALTRTPPATPPAASSPPPRVATADLFAENCGVCHTLRPPGTTGTAGPNLNRLRPSAARVLAAIRNGGRGSGLMPPGILTGRDAERVALFVARASRR